MKKMRGVVNGDNQKSMKKFKLVTRIQTKYQAEPMRSFSY